MSLDVIVAGAGIGGVTAALALSRAGFRVTVLERADHLREVGAGLQLSPNATRILDRLQVLDELRPVAVVPRALRIRRGRDGSLLALVPLGSEAESRWGAPTFVVHRADLQRCLVEATRSEPNISLALGVSVTGFVGERDRVIVRTEAGEFSGSVLVGADGLHSIVRRAINGRAANTPAFAGRTAWRTTIDADSAPTFCLAHETNLWLGRSAHLVHYPVCGGAAVNVVAVIEDHDAEDGHGTPREWDLAGPSDLLLRRYADWHQEVRDLLAAARDWRRWPLFRLPPLPRWSAGRITLLGDAAHPMMPFLAQGAAQAIEDAAGLAEALATKADPVEALRTYEARRLPRATAIQRQSQRQGEIYHLAGPAALARDFMMRAMGPRQLIGRFDWIYRL